MYSVRKKNIVPKPAIASRLVRSAARKPGMRNTPSGMSGFLTTDSAITNAASSAAAPTSSQSVVAEPQPWSGALTRA